LWRQWPYESTGMYFMSSSTYSSLPLRGWQFDATYTTGTEDVWRYHSSIGHTKRIFEDTQQKKFLLKWKIIKYKNFVLFLCLSLSYSLKNFEFLRDLISKSIFWNIISFKWKYMRQMKNWVCFISVSREKNWNTKNFKPLIKLKNIFQIPSI
jgi:hypothetical protein